MTTTSKSILSQDLILAARQGLLPVNEGAWLGGFGNMLRKELGQWWGTRAWLVQTIIWVLILNGITTITALTEGATPIERMQLIVETFIGVGIGAIGIGTIITAQGAMVGEKQLGTAAWVMSKPASRSAFILAKLVAYTIGFWVTAIIIPAIIFVITARVLIPVAFPMSSFLIGLALVALSQLFYLTLTLMLGTFFDSRGPIAGIGITFIMIGLLLKSIIPLMILILTPWPLPDISSGLVLGTPLPSVWPVPIIATAIWIVVMTALALWRFQFEEF